MGPERIPGGWRVRLRHGAARGRFIMPNLPEPAASARYGRLVRMRDRLVACGMAEEAGAFLTTAAGAATDDEFALIEERVAKACAEKEAPKDKRPKTMGDIIDLWLSGDLHRRFPDKVRLLTDKSLEVARARAGKIKAKCGDVQVQKFSEDHADDFMASLPKGLRQSSRAKYARMIAFLLKLAVNRLKLIPASPLPDDWVPSAGPRAEFQFLWPEEDAQLVGCPRISREHRFIWGFWHRNGVRPGELFRITWSDIDLVRGNISLDKTKTRRPRRWRMDDDVVRALRLKAAKTVPAPKPGDKVFRFEGKISHLAEAFRFDLGLCGIGRKELHGSTQDRRQIRAYDCRGTFVTVALGSGKAPNEQWVMDRTGHATSAQLQEYNRDVRYAREHGIKWFGPLDELIYPGLDRAAGAENMPIPEQRSYPGRIPSRRLPVVQGTNPAEPSDRDVPSQGAGPPSVETTGPEYPQTKTKGAEASSVQALVSASAPEGTQREGAPVASAGAPVDPVEAALALALEAAVRADRLDLVPGIVAELGERRRAREAVPGVTSLEQHRAKRNGDKP